ncbi:hypothetical protein [Roseibium sp.]|uniref:hypothetical protein n=1 Tax=Roseibium sp. TaxID=1936156 RepID=UPI003B523B09
MAEHAPMFQSLTIITLTVILLIFGMKYYFQARSNRLQSNNDTAYRDLAARAAKAQEDNAAMLSGLKASVSEIEGRLQQVEKVLKEVE